jgi:hypothetical protein
MECCEYRTSTVNMIMSVIDDCYVFIVIKFLASRVTLQIVSVLSPLFKPRNFMIYDHNKFIVLVTLEGPVL